MVMAQVVLRTQVTGKRTGRTGCQGREGSRVRKDAEGDAIQGLELWAWSMWSAMSSSPSLPEKACGCSGFTGLSFY